MASSAYFPSWSLENSIKLRRVAVTAASPSLNGYQKGRYFYCLRDISLDNNHADFADVDHFFPHDLRKCDAEKPINGG